MQLYGRRSSINVQKVGWCLTELGQVEGRDYERIDAGLAFGVVDTPAFLKLNPNGLVPVLIDGDVVLWESNTIMRYLAASHAAQHGESSLLPSDPVGRAMVERWMDWQLGNLWPTLRGAFLGCTRTPEALRDVNAIRQSYNDTSRQLAIIDGVLASQPYLAGDHFTMADIGNSIAVHRWIALHEAYPALIDAPPVLPNVLAWYQGLAARPGFQLAVAE